MIHFQRTFPEYGFSEHLELLTQLHNEGHRLLAVGLDNESAALKMNEYALEFLDRENILTPTLARRAWRPEKKCQVEMFRFDNGSDPRAVLMYALGPSTTVEQARQLAELLARGDTPFFVAVTGFGLAEQERIKEPFGIS